MNRLGVHPFVDVLLSGPYQSEADMNKDQVVKGLKKPIVARFHLALESLALRQQLEVLERSGQRPKLRQRD